VLNPNDLNPLRRPYTHDEAVSLIEELARDFCFDCLLDILFEVFPEEDDDED